MKIYKIDNYLRGLEDNTRRPVVSSRPKEIDKMVKWKFAQARRFVGDMVAYTMIGQEPPKKMVAELYQDIEEIILLAKWRIKALKKPSERDIEIVLGYTEEIAKVPYIDEDWRDSKIREIYQAIGHRLQEKLKWEMSMLGINNHPYWHYEAYLTIELLSRLNMETSSDLAKLEEKIAEYHSKQEGPNMEEMSIYRSKFNKRIQKSPDDDLFARERAKGTANRGTEYNP